MVVMFAFVVLFTMFAIVMFIMMIRLRSIMQYHNMLAMSLVMTVANYRREPGSSERIEGNTERHEEAKTSRAKQPAKAGSAPLPRHRVRVSLFSISHDEVSSTRRAGRSWSLLSRLARLLRCKRTGIHFQLGF